MDRYITFKKQGNSYAIVAVEGTEEEVLTTPLVIGIEREYQPLEVEAMARRVADFARVPFVLPEDHERNYPEWAAEAVE